MDTGILALIIVFGGMAIVVGIIFVLHDLLKNKKKSKIIKFILKLYKLITKLPLKSELDKVNKLHRCDYGSCNRLFRSYQHDMYKARHDKARCPHCEKSNYSTEVSKPDKWMDTHPDCMKVTKSGYRNILKTIDLLHRLRKEDEQQKRFEEYNKLKVDLSWIKNLELEKENVK